VALAQWEVSDQGVAQLMNGPEVAALLRQMGQQGAEAARALAPVRSGNYRDSLVALEPALNEAGQLQGGFGTDSSIWHLVEFGTAHSPPHRVLANAYMTVSGGSYAE
jgi:HK97 gp10 family phage protein